jgi:hypothetical protein
MQPQTVALARKLRRKGATLQAIATALAEQRMFNGKGQPFAPAQIARMVARSETRKHIPGARHVNAT